MAYTIDPVINGQRQQQIVKVGDTQPIGTIVDYDGAEVPNGWEEVEPKSILTAKLSNEHVIATTNINEEIKDFEEYNKVGTKFSISNGVIKIGAGVSKILISYKANLYNGSSQTITYTYLIKKSGNTTNVLTQEAMSWHTTNLIMSNMATPILLDVSENDEIWLRVYGGQGQKVSVSPTRVNTYITIEEV